MDTIVHAVHMIYNKVKNTHSQTLTHTHIHTHTHTHTQTKQINRTDKDKWIVFLFVQSIFNLDFIPLPTNL